MCCCSYLIWRNAATGSKFNFKYWLLLTFAWICKTLCGIIGLQTVWNGRIGRIKKFTQTLLETWAWFQIRARGCQKWISFVEILILEGDENRDYRTIWHQGLKAENLAHWVKSGQFSTNCPGAKLPCFGAKLSCFGAKLSQHSWKFKVQRWNRWKYRVIFNCSSPKLTKNWKVNPMLKLDNTRSWANRPSHGKNMRLVL